MSKEALSPQSIYLTARKEGMDQSMALTVSGLAESQAPELEKLLDRQLNTSRRRLPTREDVIEGFMDAVSMASNSMELVAAWREIGRVVGAYEPTKVELHVEAPTARQITLMSDEQLAQLVGPESEVLDAEYEEITGDGH